MLYHLKNDGKITHKIFSIYLDRNDSKKSSIKFGGWDEVGHHNESTLTWFESYDSDTEPG